MFGRKAKARMDAMQSHIDELRTRLFDAETKNRELTKRLEQNGVILSEEERDKLSLMDRVRDCFTGPHKKPAPENTELRRVMERVGELAKDDESRTRAFEALGLTGGGHFHTWPAPHTFLARINTLEAVQRGEKEYVWESEDKLVLRDVEYEE